MDQQEQEQLLKKWAGLAHSANYSTAGLASLCGLSVRQFERNFKQLMGQPPKRWLRELRLAAALRLLENGVSIKETSYAFRYKHPNHFSNDFRKFFGFPPSHQSAL